MSFVPGTHFYRQKTKYTKPAPNPVPTTREDGHVQTTSAAEMRAISSAFLDGAGTMVLNVIKTRTGTQDGHKLPSMDRGKALASVVDGARCQVQETLPSTCGNIAGHDKT